MSLEEARKQDLLRRLGLAHGTIRKRTSSVLIRATDTFSKNAQKHKAALLLKSLMPSKTKKDFSIFTSIYRQDN